MSAHWAASRLSPPRTLPSGTSRSTSWATRAPRPASREPTTTLIPAVANRRASLPRSGRVPPSTPTVRCLTSTLTAPLPRLPASPKLRDPARLVAAGSAAAGVRIGADEAHRPGGDVGLLQPHRDPLPHRQPRAGAGRPHGGLVEQHGALLVAGLQ